MRSTIQHRGIAQPLCTQLNNAAPESHASLLPVPSPPPCSRRPGPPGSAKVGRIKDNFPKRNAGDFVCGGSLQARDKTVRGLKRRRVDVHAQVQHISR